MIARDAQETIVVVPDGLAYDPAVRRVCPEPSFVFRAVLHHVLERHREQRVFIAPANTFGGPVTEQAVGAAWLSGRGCTRVTAPDLEHAGYIDTWGNAVLLKRWLIARRLWPVGPAILVSAFRHARRAELCFRRNGYAFVTVERVPYSIENEPLVPRLSYYRYPWLHETYEGLAWFRDRFRSTQRTKPS